MLARQVIVASYAAAVVLLAIRPIAAQEAKASKEATNTLGASPPREAVILFDGSNQEAWLSQMNRQWENSDGRADWKITADGSLEVVPGAGSLITKERFSDFRLHLEFRLPEGDINGGVFMLARYELAISASNKDGSRCGSFDNLENKILPAKRVDRPVNEWQAFDVVFRAPQLNDSGQVVANARATVRFNGQTIHDNVELGPRKGAAKRLGDAAIGPIMLQEHGGIHLFRNIWIVHLTSGEVKLAPSIRPHRHNK